MSRSTVSTPRPTHHTYADSRVVIQPYIDLHSTLSQLWLNVPNVLRDLAWESLRRDPHFHRYNRHDLSEYSNRPMIAILESALDSISSTGNCLRYPQSTIARFQALDSSSGPCSPGATFLLRAICPHTASSQAISRSPHSMTDNTASSISKTASAPSSSTTQKQTRLPPAWPSQSAPSTIRYASLHRTPLAPLSVTALIDRT